MSDLRILVLARDPLARAGLATLLADQPGCQVVGRLASDADIAGAVTLHRPDVLLWDLGWDAASALAGLAELRETEVPVAVLLPDASDAMLAWNAGARALLHRDADPGRLCAALAALAHGLVVLDPDFAASVPAPAFPDREPWRKQDTEPPVESLTARELEVLRLLAEGLPNKSIAVRLGVSEHTVKFHVNAILGKLAAASRTEAVVRATRLGLILL